MNLLLYTSGIDDASKRLLEIATNFAAKGTAEIFYTLDTLTGRLNRPRNNYTVVVLHAATEEELSHVVSLYDFFHDIKLILILPDRKEPTIAKGHKLHPRFLSYADGNFSDIDAVLNKMFENKLYEKTWIN